MKRKFLACDVDGTLIHFDKQKISSNDLQAIKQFQNAGHLFALCTGRTFVWTLPILEKHNLEPNALILCNGSAIYIPDSEYHLEFSTIHTNKIPNHIGIEIIKYVYSLENYTIYWDNGIKTFELQDRLLKCATSIIQEDNSIHIKFEDISTVTDDFASIGTAPISQNPLEAKILKDNIFKQWGLKIDLFQNQFFLDIAPQNASKGSGIKKLVDFWDKHLELYGIGDSYNDQSMFEFVGKNNAFIMNNADEPLKSLGRNVSSVAECIDIILSENK
ncbi:MAG: HAD-IIB family hydrolase [Brevinemataceae bacterium]